MDGRRRQMRLPALKAGSHLTFSTERRDQQTTRVCLETDDKQVRRQTSGPQTDHMTDHQATHGDQLPNNADAGLSRDVQRGKRISELCLVHTVRLTSVLIAFASQLNIGGVLALPNGYNVSLLMEACVTSSGGVRLAHQVSRPLAGRLLQRTRLETDARVTSPVRAR